MKKLVLALPLLLASCLVYEERQVIPAQNPVTIGEVITMKSQGAPDSAILAEIYQSGVYHNPTAEDIVWMKQAGLSDAVITAMINAPIGMKREAQVITRRTYDDTAASSAVSFGVGALLGWSIGRSHRHYYHQSSGCRRW